MAKQALSRIAWCIVVFVGASAGCHRASNKTNLVKVVLQADWCPQPEQGGFYSPAERLLQGCRVGFEHSAWRVLPERGAESVGAVQFGGLEPIADGQPLVAVARTIEHDPQGIMVRKDSPIRSFAALNGHTVAIKTGATLQFAGTNYRQQ